jgi:predicted dehydrogenase
VRNDVNAFWDLAPHDVSIFNHLVDSEPAWVSAVGACLLGNDRHDVGFASITYKDGTVAHLHVSWLDPFKVRELVVVGWDERIVFDDLSPTESIRIFEKGVMVGVNPDVGSGLVVSDGGIHSPSIPKGEPLKNQVGAFLRDIVSGDRPFSDGLTGLRVVEVMDAMNRSAALHGSPTSVTVSEPSKRASLP